MSIFTVWPGFVPNHESDWRFSAHQGRGLLFRHVLGPVPGVDVTAKGPRALLNDRAISRGILAVACSPTRLRSSIPPAHHSAEQLQQRTPRYIKGTTHRQPKEGGHRQSKKTSKTKRKDRVCGSLSSCRVPVCLLSLSFASCCPSCRVG